MSLKDFGNLYGALGQGPTDKSALPDLPSFCFCRIYALSLVTKLPIACTSYSPSVKRTHLAALAPLMNTSKSLIVVALAFTALQVQAHGGRTNAEGCHNDRKNGGYHCHNGKASTAGTRSSFNNSTTATNSKRSGKTYYPNCAAVRADGAAPLRRGEPGYASHLDRDNDGVACE